MSKRQLQGQIDHPENIVPETSSEKRKRGHPKKMTFNATEKESDIDNTFPIVSVSKKRGWTSNFIGYRKNNEL